MQPAPVALNVTPANPAQPAANAGSPPAPGTPSFAQTLASKVDANNTLPQANAPQAKPQIPPPVNLVSIKIFPKTTAKSSQASAQGSSQNLAPSGAPANVPANVTASALAANLSIAIPVAEVWPNSGESQPTPQDVLPRPNPVESQPATAMPASPATFVPNALTGAAAIHDPVPQQSVPTGQPTASFSGDPDVLHDAAPTTEPTGEATPAASDNLSVTNLPPAPDVQAAPAKSDVPANIGAPEPSGANAPTKTTEPLTSAIPNMSPAASQALPVAHLAADSTQQLSQGPAKSDSDPKGRTLGISPDTPPANATLRVNTTTPASPVSAKASVPTEETLPASKVQAPSASEKGLPATDTLKKADHTPAKSEVKLPLPAEAAAPSVPKLKEQGNASENNHSDAQDPAPQKDTSSSPENNSGDSQQNTFALKTAPDAKTSTDSRSTAVTALEDSANANQTTAAANQGGAVANPLVSQHAAGQVAAKENNNSQAASSDTQPSTSTQSPSNPRLNDTHEIVDAQISGNASQSEIHLAMQVDRLGPVELHAHVSGEQMGAAILVEKREAHAALAVELPALQQALSDKNLRVEHVWLTQSALHSTAGDTGNAAGQQSRQQSNARLASSNSLEAQPALLAAMPEQDGIFDERGHLSVRA